MKKIKHITFLGAENIRIHMKHIATLAITLILGISSLSAQQIKRVGAPYIRNYFPEDYNASKQNWCGVQDCRGILYVANTQGILEYDGVTWRTISTSKNSSALSFALSPDGRRVYVGGNSDLGYLEPDSCGNTRYVSLTPRIPEKFSNNIKVYGIAINDGGSNVVYCSTSQIMLYENDSTLKVYPIGGNETFSYITNFNGHIYINHSAKGYCEVINSKGEDAIQLLPGTDTLASTQVVAVLSEYSGNKLLVTKKHGAVLYRNGELAPLNVEINKMLVSSDLYCATTLKGGYFAFGTLKNGVIITDKNLNHIKTLNTSNGLCNNQVISLYQSHDGGLWIFTNNGISYADLYSPISTIPNIKRVSAIGTFNGKVYVGSDNLYAIDEQQLNAGIPISNIMSTVQLPADKARTSIISIDPIDGQLICGTTQGVVAITDQGECYSADNTKQVVRTIYKPRQFNNIILSGSIGGISVYNIEKGRWHKLTSIDKGFDVETRHIVEDNDGNFWISKKETGIFKITIDSTFKEVTSSILYDDTKGLPSAMGNYIFETGDDIVVATQHGFYQYDKTSDTFVESEKYNKLFTSKVESNYIFKDRYGKTWVTFMQQNKRSGKSETRFGYFTGLDSTQRHTDLFVPFASRITKLAAIADSCYLIGCDNELIHYDAKLDKNLHAPFKAFIRHIEITRNDSLLFGGAYMAQDGKIDTIQNTKDKISLPYEFNGIKFQFGANAYEFPEQTKFKCYLEHNDDGWSDWKNENFKEFNNLSPGTYTLKVQAKNYFGFESEVAQYTFTILPPWYMTIWAYTLYVLILAAIVVVIIKIYLRKLLKDKQRLEQIVSDRTAEIVEKNKEITEKNKSITDSINYASRIQTAMLPLESRIKEALPEHFILFRPRDIVSGDFYWFAETPDRIIITAADCTGHGVPGAFMSMVGAEILTTLVSKGIVESHDILTHQNRYIRKALNQDQTENHDGMDMALCSIDKKRNVVEFTGAKNPLIYISADGELTTIKADKQGIGGDQIEEDFHYTKNEIPIQPGTWYYMFSDGYQDQFGGPQHRKFMIKHMRELLLEIHTRPAAEQREILNSRIEQWMKDGNTEQTDDILVIGFKL